MVVGDHIFLWGFVGMGTGTVLALTGSGGAVVSIPILMTFGGYGVKEASGYGLLALGVGAAISWLIQRDNTHYPVAAALIVFASIVAFLSAPLKLISPHWLIIALLNVACVFGLYSLWFLRKPDDPGEERSLFYQLKTASIGGMMTGLINTMTGLGGAVVIIPWLTGITRLSFERAMACSLLTVSIIAPVSAWRQETINLGWGEWVALCAMILLTSFSITKIMPLVPPHRSVMVRKTIFTVVIVTTMARTLFELL